MLPTAEVLVRRLDGADCAHWQPDAGPVDFNVLRKATWWLAWKATQSTRYVDPTFRWARSHTNLLGFRHRLWYHWLSSTTDPVAQADHYVNSVGTFPPGQGVMLDAEEDGIDVNRCVAWLERVEQTTRRPSSVYSGLYVAAGSIWKSERIRESRYGRRAMHLAAYVSTAGLLARLTSTGNLGRQIDAWQWSSKGPVPGVTGACDMNTIIDRPAFDRCCAVNATSPPTLPAQPSTPPGAAQITPLQAAALGDTDMALRIVADKSKPGAPERWITNGLVRVVPTEQSLDWATRTGLVVAGQTIRTPELLTPAELAGIPIVAA